MEEKIVNELAREIVTVEAADELEDFDIIFEEFERNPNDFKAGAKTSNKLGSGVEVAGLVTPIIICIVKEVVKYVVSIVKTEVAKEGREMAGKVVKHKLKLWFDQMKQNDEANSGYQKIRAAAIKAGKDLGLDDDLATKYADKVIKQLVSVPASTSNSVE